MNQLRDLETVREIIRARGGRIGEPLHLEHQSTSTNDDAKKAAREGAPHGSVWVVETQTHGRGRQGRAWISPPGENLLFSVLLRIPQVVPSRVPPLSLAVGLVVRDAIAKAVGHDEAVVVKWPNDVLVRGKKVAGILIESGLAGSKVEYLVVGIGVNVHTREFPPELQPIATSIALEHPSAPPDRAEILADILAGLDHDIEHVAHRGLGIIHGRLSARDALLGRSVTSEDGKIAGIARGIDLEGRLLIESTDGLVSKVASGEVRLTLDS
jgi:BirA family transcriptional regulator, biotin operon repressor / biotin---[acetyl-CoA-carboxylase] ligase